MDSNVNIMNINDKNHESSPANCSQRSNESSISDEPGCQVATVECNKKSKSKGGTSSSASKKELGAQRHSHEVEKILKSICSSDEKLKLISNKYSETLHAHRKLKTDYKSLEEKLIKISRENEQNQQQRSKAVLARSRLENLCRELQKLNRAQKEEIDLKLRLEEEKRKEISATFQSAFAEMNTLTNQNTEKNSKMREENAEMREKIKSVRERIEISEQQLEKVRQQAQLELQLAEAKMATVKMEMTAEKECLLKEKQQLLLKLTEYQVKISELQATEAGLRSQISMYTEKYDDFQNALTKSNEVFNGFNEEMEKMSKKIIKLEKETCLWKQRWEKSHAALFQMTADKQMRDAEMEKQNQKIALLQKLCKAFQTERAELLSQLKTCNNNSNTTSKTIKSEDVDIKQINELSEDCEKLKNDLAQLQGSLNETILEENQNKIDKPLETTNVVEVNSKTEINGDKPSENSKDCEQITRTDGNDKENVVVVEENLIKPEESANVDIKEEEEQSGVEIKLNEDLKEETTPVINEEEKGIENLEEKNHANVEDTKVNENLSEKENQINVQDKVEDLNGKIELNSSLETHADDLNKSNNQSTNNSVCNNSKTDEKSNLNICSIKNDTKECIINGTLNADTNGQLNDSQLNGNSIPNESHLDNDDEVHKNEKNSQDIVDEDKKDLNAKQKTTSGKKGKDKRKKKNF